MVLGGIRAGGGTDPEGMLQVHEDKAGQEEREVGGGFLCCPEHQRGLV